MKQRILLIFCILIAFVNSKAQVTVDTKMDSAAIFIGQRMGITIDVSADKGKTVEMPNWDSLQQIIPGIEFVNSTPVDTEYVNDGKRMVLHQKFYVTSFDTALYFIPGINVKVDGKEYTSQKMALKVLTYEIDTLHTDSIFGMKDEMAPAFAMSDWTLVVYLSLISVMLSMILIYVAVRLKQNKPIIRRIRREKHLPPHKAAMQKIEEIKEDKMLWQGEDSKEYYTKLTDTLRQYIKERYAIDATEMVTSEIIEQLQAVNDPEAIREMRELFETADLVKFAKYSTLINENDRNLVNAIEYIQQTKQEETEQKPQPEVEVIVEPRSRELKNILIVSLCLASAVLIGVAGYMIYRIYMLTL